MSDKKEIATLSIKPSVDSADLDKLEAQLKRIEGLMLSAGLKQPASGEYAESGPLKKVIKTESEDQRRIKALETKLSSLESSMLSVQQTIADSDRAFAASLEHLRADIQSVKSGWL
ncbi:hypothetical protein WMR74_004357 [Providencia rettgeri]